MIRQCLALLLADRLNFILVTNHVLQNPWSENWLSVGFSGFLKINSPAISNPAFTENSSQNSQSNHTLQLFFQPLTTGQDDTSKQRSDRIIILRLQIIIL